MAKIFVQIRFIWMVRLSEVLRLNEQKGHMTETGQNLKDQLRRLIDLQIIDEDVYRFKRDLREKPLLVEEFKAEFEAKKATLKQLEDKLKTIQVAQKSLDNDLKDKEAGIVKADQSLSLLKTNKEYSAKLLEIENLKADKSIVEEKILMGFDEVEAAKKAIDAEKAIVAQYEKDFNTKKKEVDDALAIAQDQLKVKESQRQRIAPEVRPDYLSRYERILNNKDGLAIVPMNDKQSCSGCYMHLTEQRVNEIKRYDQLVACDSCARILYLADDL